MDQRRMSRLVRKPHRLVLKWDKRQRDLVGDVTPRFGNSDIRFAMDMLPSETLKEFESRGYDLSTMRFQIDKTPEAIAEHERIAGRA